jgi:hypothetical protein
MFLALFTVPVIPIKAANAYIHDIILTPICTYKNTALFFALVKNMRIMGIVKLSELALLF